jgi:hypothetical protein
LFEPDAAVLEQTLQNITRLQKEFDSKMDLTAEGLDSTTD